MRETIQNTNGKQFHAVSLSGGKDSTAMLLLMIERDMPINMLEVAMNRSPTVKIGRDAEYPTGFVQQRFEKITSMHIEKVMDGIRENTTRVWNTKAYLMAALFNSVSTIDNHYAMLVNHDFHGGP